MRKQFLLTALMLVLFIFTAGVPSPLYGIYQQAWHFTPLMLTVVFAVYAFSFVLALVCIGRLSDYIGRRPVLLVVLLIEVLSMVLFAAANGVIMLVVARLLQGVATGLASATLSARLLDTQPIGKPGLAGTVTTIVPVASIGLGAFVASLLVSYAPWPRHLIFWIIVIAALILTIALLLSRETNDPQPGWRQSLKPKVFLPSGSYRALKIMGPSLIACWALIGFYLSLGPSIATILLHARGQLLGGLLVLGLTMPGAICMYYLRKWHSDKVVTLGNILASTGLLVTMYSLFIASPVLFLTGTIVAGAGFGPAFMGSFKAIMMHAEPSNRAGLASAVYIISYVAFGVPAVLAGLFLGVFNLRAVSLAYASIVVVLYAFTLLVTYRKGQLEK